MFLMNIFLRQKNWIKTKPFSFGVFALGGNDGRVALFNGQMNSSTASDHSVCESSASAGPYTQRMDDNK